MSGRSCSRETVSGAPAGTARPSPASSPEEVRRNDLDWARLLVQVLTFLLWSLRSWSIPLPHRDDWASCFLQGRWPAPIDLCALGLLLLVSGAAIRLELGALSPAEYVLRRVLRLFVPFVAGVLLLTPSQTYLELVLDGSTTLSFSGLLRSGVSTLHGYQLAYLALLFVLSLLLAPLYLIACHRKGPVSAGVRAATVAAAAVVPAALLALPLGAAVPAAAAATVICGLSMLDAGATERLWRRASPWLLGAGAGAIALSFLGTGPAVDAVRRGGAWLVVLSALGLLLGPLSRLPPQSLALRELGILFSTLCRPVTVWLAYLLPGVSGTLLRSALVTALAGAILVGLGLLARTATLCRFFLGLRPDRPDTAASRRRGHQ